MNKRYIIPTGLQFGIMLVLFLFFYSCSAVFDDRDDCLTGCRIYFKYDYNLKYADAFANEVDRITLCVFDETGKLVAQQTETGERLKEKGYYMLLDVPPGDYQLIAWGGIDDVSFISDPLTRGSSKLEDMRVIMKNPDLSNENLHPLFYGRNTEISTLTVTGNYQEYLIPMMKNTKQIRVVLQDVDGLPISKDAFRFEITAAHHAYDYLNQVNHTRQTLYTPYAEGVSSVEDGNQMLSVAFAELSTGRLMKGQSVRLRVYRNSDNSIVLDIPLIEYFLLVTELESQKQKMTDQEYLDRRDTYSLVLFLRNDSWWRMKIIVNEWVLRLNDSSL